ncbi:MAG: hypothetical protein JW863_21860 [Chitinispirillaceae bacterium]|nr:hypothetical protein [Chitinispirillaceae bacterium]
MKIANVIFFHFLMNTICFAAQFVVNVELHKNNGIIFNQSGDLEMLQYGWMEQKEFDFSLALGDCPTVCGVRCPLDILSKSTIYIYKSNPAEFPLFGQDIDLLNGDFDTSARYFDRDSIQYYTIELEGYSKYYILKSSSDNYFLFIIDSLTISGGCPPEQPLCCVSYGIGVIYGRIILQTNGLPQFDQPAHVQKKHSISVDYQFEHNADKLMDIQGRLIKNKLNSNGIRLYVREDNRVYRIVLPF